MPERPDERLRQKKRWRAERQIELLGIDITIVKDCVLVPDMNKDLAKKPLSMGKTLR